MSPLSLITLLLCSAGTVNSQSECDSAPDEATRVICRQITAWDQISRRMNVSTRPAAVALSLPTRPSSALQCHSVLCICMFMLGEFTDGHCRLPDGRSFGKAVRKEFRMLSQDEISAFVSAVWTVVNKGQYRVLSDIHRDAQQSPGAHSGPAFLPWHREFVKRFEIALRMENPDVALPYWDSTLESALPAPQDSALFSEMLFGNTQGSVTTGLFANFNGLGSHITQRQMGVSSPTPFTEQDIEAMLRKSAIEQVLAATAPQQACPIAPSFEFLEFTHGKPHVFVGGDMFEPRTSTNDPLFWLHHSFVDFIWEQWRQRAQTREQRSTQYPEDNIACSSRAHFSNTIMTPFEPLVNSDGLSNTYIDDLYEFAPRPSCSTGPDCGSSLLFCDRSHGQPRCAARIRLGGQCAGFRNGEAMCYKSICHNDVCSNDMTTQSTSTQTTTTTTSTAASTPTTTQATSLPAITSTAETIGTTRRIILPPRFFGSRIGSSYALYRSSIPSNIL